MLLSMAIVFFTAAGITALLTPLVRWWCVKHGLYAPIGERTIHTRPTPHLGGIAIFVGFTTAMLVSFTLTGVNDALTRDYFEILRLGLMLVGVTLLWIVSLIDDIKDLPPLPRLFWQFVCALIAVGPYLWEHTLHGPTEQASGIIFTGFTNPLTGIGISFHALSPWLAIAVTLLWIVGMTNMLNWLDGLDGLAAGVTLIAASILAIHTFMLQQYTIVLLPLALAGVCCGFLPYNFHPARTFMGDSGAMALGYLLAIVAIIGGAKLSSALLVLGIPILDAIWSVISRYLMGYRVMRADRGHLHHRLLDLGLSQRQVVMLYYSVSLSFGAFALLVPGEAHLLKLGALALLAMLISGVILYTTWRQPQRVGAARQRRYGNVQR